MRTISIYFFCLILGLLFTALNLKAQKDTVYLVTNGIRYNQMPANFVSLDTFSQKVDSVSFSNLLVGGSATATFSDTANTAYNHYFIRYTVNELQGGNSGFLSVDTNGTSRSFTALSTVTGVFLDDTLEIGSGGTLDFVLSAASSATALQIQGEIYHETTFVLIRPEALRTVYYDNVSQQEISSSAFNIGNYRIDSTLYDTLYYAQTGLVRLRPAGNNTSDTLSLPITFPKYLVEFSMVHFQGAGYGYNVDTNGVSFSSDPTIGFNLNLRDTVVVFSNPNSNVIFSGTNMNSQASQDVIDLRASAMSTVDSIFISSLTTSLGKDKQAESFDLELYPNPTSNFIRLSALKPKSRFYQLYNIQGQILQEGRVKQQMDVSHLPAGVYFLRLPDQGINKKFVKQ